MGFGITTTALGARTTLTVVVALPLSPNASATRSVMAYVPAPVKVAVVLAAAFVAFGKNMTMPGDALQAYVSVPVPVALPVKLAAAPVIGRVEFTVIVTAVICAQESRLPRWTPRSARLSSQPRRYSSRSYIGYTRVGVG